MKSKRKYSLLEAKAKLESLCAYQERSAHELNQKMIGWGIVENDRNALLANLIEGNFLSEERYAEAFVSGKVRIKKWGRNKIRQELKKKFISQYSIDKAFNQIDGDTYWDNLVHLTERKLEGLIKDDNPYSKRAKVYRYLTSKGYEYDLIEEAYNHISNSI